MSQVLDRKKSPIRRRSAPVDSLPQPAPEITKVPSERMQKIERRVSVAATLIPFVGALIAVPLLWGHGIGWSDVAVFFVFYCLTGLGVTVGFHRMLTHQSFEARDGVRAFFAIAGSMALQGPVIRWVGDHRRHHAYSDLPGDPHSPHLDEAQGVKGVLSGLWHSHMGWLFSKEVTNVPRFAPELLKDPLMRKIDKQFPMWVAVSLVAPAVAGGILTRSFMGAFTGFIWGGLVRIFFLHHVTWSINSICHFYGKRPFESSDYSANNWMLSLISFGEAWHNNHHAFPTSARHGILRGQFDPSAAVIGALEKLGLVSNVKRPSPRQLEAKRA